jgi:hypothetical protein
MDLERLNMFKKLWNKWFGKKKKYFFDFKIFTKEESEAFDNINPYHVFDGRWGGWGVTTWYKCKDTLDVIQINHGPGDLEIERIWRNKEQKWDKEILPTDYGQLRREIDIRAVNEWREKRRNEPPATFDKMIYPIITQNDNSKDISSLLTYDYDMRQVLLDTPIK